MFEFIFAVGVRVRRRLVVSIVENGVGLSVVVLSAVVETVVVRDFDENARCGVEVSSKRKVSYSWYWAETLTAGIPREQKNISTPHLPTPPPCLFAWLPATPKRNPEAPLRTTNRQRHEPATQNRQNQKPVEPQTARTRTENQ